MNTLFKRILPAGIAAVCLIGCGVCEVVSSALTGSHISQQAAERWQSGDLKFAQISVFCSSQSSFYPSSAEGIRESVKAALNKASIEAPNENARIWYDCFSIQRGTSMVTGKKMQSAQALVTAVGGDFFTMHPMQLMDGGYFFPDDLMHDRVVIDELLAWQVFGSDAVAGQEITVDGTTYLIAGVVKPESDRASSAAYGKKPRLYLPYQEQSSSGSDPYSMGGDYGDYGMYGGENSGSDAELVTCYEAVLPDPVRDFARNTLNDALGERDGTEVVVNTGRASLKNRWHNLRHLREMVVSDCAIAYPYWENAARMTDFTAAQLLGFEIAFLAFPVLYGLWLLWKGYRALDRFIAKKREALKRKYRTIGKDPYSI